MLRHKKGPFTIWTTIQTFPSCSLDLYVPHRTQIFTFSGGPIGDFSIFLKNCLTLDSVASNLPFSIGDPLRTVLYIVSLSFGPFTLIWQQRNCSKCPPMLKMVFFLRFLLRLFRLPSYWLHFQLYLTPIHVSKGKITPLIRWYW